jgi:hypothetical protein
MDLDDLASLPRWVPWRNEPCGRKSTKVPYGLNGKRAKADDPATWGRRAEAEASAARLVNGQGGGIGFMLGVAPDGVAFGGIDLDTCRSADGSLEPWAIEIVDRFRSYTEISPSGTGAKIFFRYRAVDLPELRRAMGTEHGREFKRKGGDHPPAIELHLLVGLSCSAHPAGDPKDGRAARVIGNLRLSNRYFTVTGQRLDRLPAELTTADKETLLWLIREAGPAFAGAANSKGTRPIRQSARRRAAFPRSICGCNRRGETPIL